MPEKHERYEEEIEKILESSGDLPEAPNNSPMNNMTLVEELRIWLNQAVRRKLGFISAARLLIVTVAFTICFFITRQPIFAWLGAVAFLSVYLVFFIGRQGNGGAGLDSWRRWNKK
jgi:hypothetical protein